MEYIVNKLSKISGVSTRTLRYYDEIGLLKPSKINSSGYRIYENDKVDILQQILFYKKLGIDLNRIKKIINDPNFDEIKALKDHLIKLEENKNNLDKLIKNIKNTLLSKKGGKIMKDEEKFEGLKNKMVDNNEQKYGNEIREKYGDDEVNYSNQKIKNMTKEEYDKIQKLSLDLNETLKEAFKIGDPKSELAVKACKLHKEWLTFFWKSYSKEAHKGIAQMYVDDERFKKYYDSIEVGCAEFLRDAIFNYVDVN